MASSASSAAAVNITFRDCEFCYPGQHIRADTFDQVVCETCRYFGHRCDVCQRHGITKCVVCSAKERFNNTTNSDELFDMGFLLHQYWNGDFDDDATGTEHDMSDDDGDGWDELDDDATYD